MRLQYPVVYGQLILCWIGFALVYFELWPWVFNLMFQPTQFATVGLSFEPATEGLLSGQVWRMLSPSYIHFGWLHIAFNSMCLWLLGRVFEQRKGSIRFAAFCVLAGVGSNWAQYLMSGPQVFGGFSGIVYALCGYVLVSNTLIPEQKFILPHGLLIQLMIFLFVGVSGVLEWLNVARVANAAHFGGLIIGAVYALVTVKKM